MVKTINFKENEAALNIAADLVEDARCRVFDSLADDNDWRGPIDVIVSLEALEAMGGLDLIRSAVEFYTATRPTFEYDLPGDSVHIRAKGYRAGPAA